MNHNKYHILINEIEFASASYINLLHLNDYETDVPKLILMKCNDIKIHNDLKIKEKDIITISHYINNICIYEFDSYLLDYESVLNNHQELSFIIKTSDLPPLNISAILNEWSNGNEILYWKNNKCKEAKKLWLTACLYWQQTLPLNENENENEKFNIFLNLDNVNNLLDFFCMLGEAFWGRKGYIGKDFFGFNDLLNELTSKTAEVNIHIKNEKKLKNFLEKISPINYNYYDIFINILIDNNCNIINVENKS